MHYYLKTCAYIGNPTCHPLHKFDRSTRDLYVPKWNGRGGMTRPPSYPISLKVEAAIASAEINAELVCPSGYTQFSTRHAWLQPEETQPHWRSKQMHGLLTRSSGIQGVSWNPRITRQSLYGWIQNEWEWGQPFPFPEWWDNLQPLDQKTARQQHHLCCWGYSHHSDTELLLAHGPSSPRCNKLWLNVLLIGDWEWRHWEPFYLPYHEPPLVVQWQRHSC